MSQDGSKKKARRDEDEMLPEVEEMLARGEDARVEEVVGMTGDSVLRFYPEEAESAQDADAERNNAASENAGQVGSNVDENNGLSSMDKKKDEDDIANETANKTTRKVRQFGDSSEDETKVETEQEVRERLEQEERLREAERREQLRLEQKRRVREAREAAAAERHTRVRAYMDTPGIAGVQIFVRNPQNYNETYFEDLVCVTAPAYRMRISIGTLLREFDPFKWRGYSNDILNRLHHSDVIERTAFKEKGRINEVRFAAMMQNNLEKISERLAKVQHALTVCWHKLGTKDISHEYLINFMQCMMAPTRNSAVSLRFELSRLKDRFERYRETTTQRFLRLADFHRKRRIRSWSLAMLLQSQEMSHRLKRMEEYVNRENMWKRKSSFFGAWSLYVMKNGYESKIQYLNNRVVILTRKVQEMEKDRLLADAKEEKLLNELARMIARQLAQFLKQKCYRALQRQWMDMKVLRLKNHIERVEKRLSETQEDLDVKTEECEKLEQSLKNYTERTRVAEAVRGKLVEYLGGKIRGYLNKGMQGWKEACRRSWRLRVTALEREVVQEKQRAADSMRLCNEAESKVAGLLQIIEEKDALLKQGDREKGEIAEHFSEALKIAQGGKCMPALPSAFLCRDCGNELYYKARDERDEAILKSLADDAAPKMQFFQQRIHNFVEAKKQQTRNKSFGVDPSMLSPRSPRRTQPLLPATSPRREREHAPGTFRPIYGVERTADEKVQLAQVKATTLLQEHAAAAERRRLNGSDEERAEKAHQIVEERQSKNFFRALKQQETELLAKQTSPRPTMPCATPSIEDVERVGSSFPRQMCEAQLPKQTDTHALLLPSHSIPREFQK
ncbi:unnamed protein product [Amoebophrya sp. A25]|nr:unnamed protein product [Amoebophrya sp. A25]|eukprot:GSA25T00002102001.1